ncbi:MAG: MarR family transcriptional regulator [Clostridia bacterium]
MNDGQHILHTVKILTESIEKYANAKLKEQDLTLAQGHLLRCLKMYEGQRCPLKELEKQLNVAQSTSAGLVSRLEKKNFVKTYTDEHDKRIKIIEITDDGLAAMYYIRESFKEVEKNIFSGLTDIEKTLFKELVTKIMKNLQK